MGLASSVDGIKEQTRKNNLIEAEIRHNKKLALKAAKILLLGPGESGKSTVLKQMRILHAAGFSNDELGQQVQFIRENVIYSMIHLVQGIIKLGINLEKNKHEADIKIILEAASKSNDPDMSKLIEASRFRQAIKHLWNDNGIQECYNRRNEFQMIDSSKYFIDSVDRIGSSHYKPTVEDMLRCRRQTAGVVELQFQFKSTLFRVMDVGGQRAGRRKWIQCFEGVDSLLFVASLSEYNQTLEEDNDTNRMRESLSLFTWLCQHNIFRETPIILFLNKIDLFEEKIRIFPLRVTFPDFDGEQTLEECKEKVKEEYLKRNRVASREIYPHFTCATDSDQITFIIQSMMETMVKELMKKTGLS